MTTIILQASIRNGFDCTECNTMAEVRDALAYYKTRSVTGKVHVIRNKEEIGTIDLGQPSEALIQAARDWDLGLDDEEASE